MARVSVLMAVYNAGVYLDAAIQSILSQTHRDLMLIIVDDGSSDGSGEIIKAAVKADERVVAVYQPNRGVVAARNRLLELSEGDYVAWMDADDVSLPTRMAEQVAFLDAHSAYDCVGTWAQQIDPVGRLLRLEKYPIESVEIKAEQLRGGGLRFPTIMLRRSKALAIGGFRGPFRLGEDFDYLLRLGERGELANIDRVLYMYRQQLTSAAGSLGGQWMQYRDIILDLAQERARRGNDRIDRGEPIAVPAMTSSDQRDQISSCYRTWALDAHGNRDYRLAAHYFAKALIARPLDRQTWRAMASIMR